MRVKGEGPVPCRWMIVGEGSGAAESQCGRPFVESAPSGKELTRFLNGWSLPQRSEIWITNLIKEWEGGKPTKKGEVTEADIKRDEGELWKELKAIKPDLIIALGRHAARWFLEGNPDIEAIHGLLFKKYWAAQVQPLYIMPCYHPAAGLHRPELAARFAYDMAQWAGLVKLPVSQWQDRCWKKNDAATDYKVDIPISIQLSGLLGIDTEGAIESPYCYSVSKCPNTAVVNSLKKPDHKLALSLALRADTSVPVFHNYMWDSRVLAASGIEPPESFHDTMIMAYLLGLEPQGLKALSLRHLGRMLQEFDDVAGEDQLQFSPKTGKLLKKIKRVIKPLEEIPKEKFTQYAGADADCTRQIAPILWKKVEALGLTGIYQVDCSVLPLYARMESVGLPVSMDYYERFREDLEADLFVRTLEIQEQYSINPASPEQVSVLLFQKLGLPASKKTKSGSRYTTNDKILQAIASLHPAVQQIISYREVQKIKSFVDSVPQFTQSGRLRFKLLPTRVVSGRLAAKDPNVLALPKYSELGQRFRGGVQAPSGRLLGSWDFNQIELRVLALDSGSETLKQVFLSGGDLHARTAAKIFGGSESDYKASSQRRTAAKAVNFGIPMGMSEVGLAEQMRKNGYGFPELPNGKYAPLKLYHQLQAEVCRQWIQAVIADWGISGYIAEKHAEARKLGYVRSRGGRIRFLPSVLSTDKQIREEALRQAQAYGPQAGARWVVKQAEARIWREVIKPLWKEGVYIEPLLDIHDDLLLEFDSSYADMLKPLVEQIFITTVECEIPFTAKGAIGNNWSSL